MTDEMRDLVRRRAQDRCEYCLMPQAHHPWKLQVDHVVAEQHGGSGEADNLALSCPKCNRHKGPNIAGIDPETGEVATLFNTRREVWAQHFEWRGAILVGRTAAGRATINTLNINDPIRVAARLALIDAGVFPNV